MPVQYCRWETKSATIADGYLPTAEKWFGLDEAALAAKFGRFTKGARKGAARGFMVWRKCVEGGWSHQLHGVVRPGIIYAQLLGTYDEMCLANELTTGKFHVGAVRVDTSYGFDPAAARHARELLDLVYNATAGWPIITNWTDEQDAALDTWVDLVCPPPTPHTVRDEVRKHLKQHCIQREMDAFEIAQVVRLGAVPAQTKAAGVVVGAKD